MLCTETKLKKGDPHPKNISGRALIYGESNNTARNGTLLIIGKDLSPHVFKICSVSEYCTSIIMKFKGKTNILLTVTYLPHDKKERKLATKQLYQTTKLAIHHKLHHIIMGDFNSYPKSSPSIGAPTSPSKQLIYNHLNNYIDIGQQFDENAYIHITATSASRIDQAWVSRNLATKVIWYEVEDCNTISTDHRTVSIKLDYFEFQKAKPIYKYSIEKTSKENILEFTKELDSWTSLLSSLNWENFSNVCNNTLNKYIKRIKINPVLKDHRTNAEKKLKKQTKEINKAMIQLKNTQIPSSLNQDLHTLYRTANGHSNLSIKGLQKLKKLLIKETLLQSQQEMMDEYRLNFENMVENFYNRPKGYIKKVLGSIKPKLDLYKIYNNQEQIENDPDLIQDIINKYFKNILRDRSFDLDQFPNWHEEYSIKAIDPKV
jgi:hypothetical protein